MRLYGLTPEQLGAILRLAADNQNFEDEPPAARPALQVIDGGRKTGRRCGETLPSQALRGKIAVPG